VLRFRDVRTASSVFLAVGCLLSALTATDGFAQPNAAPLPMIPSPPAASAGPSSKFVPTGLEANGGSISSGVYSNSIFRFSLQIPPGWAVVPAVPHHGENRNPDISAPECTSGDPRAPGHHRECASEEQLPAQVECLSRTGRCPS
jgi:hypothetical protein